MPSINGGIKLVKYLLFLFNLAFVFLGITLVWVGFSVKNGFSRYFTPVIVGGDDGGQSIPPTIFIAVGFVMFIIAFLGCCGAVTENHCMMMLYSVLVGLILVIQLGAAIAAYAFQDDVEKALSGNLERSMNQYYDDSNPQIHNDTVQSWNFLQQNLKCCGVHNYADWVNATKAPEAGFIPGSCCIDGSFEGCTNSITKANLDDEAAAAKIIFTEIGKTGIFVITGMHLGTLGIIFAVIEVLGVACACMMARSIRFSYETV